MIKISLNFNFPVSANVINPDIFYDQNIFLHFQYAQIRPHNDVVSCAIKLNRLSATATLQALARLFQHSIHEDNVGLLQGFLQ